MSDGLERALTEAAHMTEVLPTYDDLDRLVDDDPIALRDAAWKLTTEVNALRVRLLRAGASAAENVEKLHDVIGERNGLRARLATAEQQRDEAIAHDRQPYPTADAYEAACRALEKHRTRANEAEARLATAETVCTLFGWTGIGGVTDAHKAATQAWMDWHHAYGSPKPDAEWEARIVELAARRDAIREATLARIDGRRP